MTENESAAIGKSHIAGVGNCFFEGRLKVIRNASGRFLIAVDGGLDAIAIELSPEGAEALRHQLGAGTTVEIGSAIEKRAA